MGKSLPPSLVSYSKGELSRYDAISLLDLRDYAQLLIALGEADLPMPLPPEDEIERQAAMFVELSKEDRSDE